MQEIAILTLAIIFGALVLWVYILACMCVVLDADLETIQKIGQLGVIFFVPVLGPLFILHIVSQHSPELVQRLYIPWPFKNMVLGKRIKLSKSDTDHDNFVEPVGRRSSHHESSED